MTLGTATVYAVDAAGLDYIGWADVEAFAGWLAANEEDRPHLNLGMAVMRWQDPAHRKGDT